jgi:hypothetical protein
VPVAAPLSWPARRRLQNVNAAPPAPAVGRTRVAAVLARAISPLARRPMRGVARLATCQKSAMYPVKERSSKVTPATTQAGSACRARTMALPKVSSTFGAATTTIAAAARTPAAIAIRRMRLSFFTPATRFRAAIGSIADASREMAWAGMGAISQAEALLSSHPGMVLGPPRGRWAAVLMGR